MHKLTHEKFLNELNTKKPGEYTLLSEYTKKTEPIKVRHNICKHEFVTTPEKLLQVNSCPYCNILKKQVIKKKATSYKHMPKISNIDEFKEFIHNKFGDEYTILSTSYTKQTDRVKVKHNKCGTIYETTARNLIRGMGCRKCSHTQTGLHQKGKHKIMPVKTNTEVKEDILQAIGSEYTLVGDYVNSNTPITVRHEPCGTIYHPLLKNIITHHTGCPLCANKSFSKGEKEMLEYIKSIYKGKVLENYKLYGYELDVYLPDLKYGFEYDGLYYHSDAKIPKDYHVKKLDTFERNGVNVINIFEDEWKEKNKEIKNLIYLYINNTTVGIPYKKNDILINCKHKDGYSYIELDRCKFPTENIFTKNGFKLYRTEEPTCEYICNGKRYNKNTGLKKFNTIWNCGINIYRKEN